MSDVALNSQKTGWTTCSFNHRSRSNYRPQCEL